MFFKIGVLKSFSNFTGKQLFYRTPLVAASVNLPVTEAVIYRYSQITFLGKFQNISDKTSVIESVFSRVAS